jgi:hypothetical protein
MFFADLQFRPTLTTANITAVPKIPNAISSTPNHYASNELEHWTSQQI